MKRGFTLVELIVSIVIVSLISGGAMVYLNRFNSRQKLEKTKDEVVTSIKLAQSYAKGRQLPSNSAEPELKYVKLELNGNFVTAYANEDAATSYFSKTVNNSETLVSFSESPIFFWSGSGRLAKNGTDEFYGENETEKVTVSYSAEETERYEIIINAMGQIKEINYYEN